MADALDGTVSGAAVAAGAAGVAGAAGMAAASGGSGSGVGVGGLAVAGAAAAGATMAMSGVARSNPSAVPYAADAYATSDDGGSGAPPPPPGGGIPPIMPPEDPDETSPVVWIAGIGAVILLALIAFLVFQMASGGGGVRPSESPAAVVVPNFVGQLITDAERVADQKGLVLVTTGESSDQPVGTILAQDPPVGAVLTAGSTVNVTISAGVDTTPVPDIRTLPESDALNALNEAGLRVGARTDAFDATIPLGSVISQSPGPGLDRRQADAGGLRGLEGARAHAEPDTHADPDADTHAHPDPDTHADTHADPDAHARAHPDARPRRRPRRRRPRRSGPPRDSTWVHRAPSGVMVRAPRCPSPRSRRPGSPAP